MSEALDVAESLGGAHQRQLCRHRQRHQDAVKNGAFPLDGFRKVVEIEPDRLSFNVIRLTARRMQDRAGG